MADKKTRLIPLDEYIRSMPRPLGDEQIADYLKNLEANESVHETIISNSDTNCLDNLGVDELKTIAVKSANQIHSYISVNRLPRDAFRQLQETQGLWAREQITARQNSSSVRNK